MRWPEIISIRKKHGVIIIHQSKPACMFHNFTMRVQKSARATKIRAQWAWLDATLWHPLRLKTTPGCKVSIPSPRTHYHHLSPSRKKIYIYCVCQAVNRAAAANRRGCLLVDWPCGEPASEYFTAWGARLERRAPPSLTAPRNHWILWMTSRGGEGECEQITHW